MELSFCKESNKKITLIVLGTISVVFNYGFLLFSF